MESKRKKNLINVKKERTFHILVRNGSVQGYLIFFIIENHLPYLWATNVCQWNKDSKKN